MNGTAAHVFNSTNHAGFCPSAKLIAIMLESDSSYLVIKTENSYKNIYIFFPSSSSPETDPPTLQQ